jgi:hypothetical protein
LWDSGRIDIGMDKSEVILSLGFPNDINRTVTSNSIDEQGVYGYKDVYAYLENGIITSFQLMGVF